MRAPPLLSSPIILWVRREFCIKLSERGRLSLGGSEGEVRECSLSLSLSSPTCKLFRATTVKNARYQQTCPLIGFSPSTKGEREREADGNRGTRSLARFTSPSPFEKFKMDFARAHAPPLSATFSALFKSIILLARRPETQSIRAGRTARGTRTRSRKPLL